MSTSLLSADESVSLLQPVLDAFVTGHRRAWQNWERLQKVCADADAAELTLMIDSTTRANIVNNYCIAETVSLIEPLTEPNKIEINTALGFTAVIVRGSDRAALVRFKLLDGELKSGNVSTARQVQLASQEWEPDLLSDLGFPGTHPPTVLTCGYALAVNETSIGGIHLVCWQHKVLCWSHPIWGAKTAEVEDLTLANMPARRAIVRSRRIGQETEGDAGVDGASS